MKPSQIFTLIVYALISCSVVLMLLRLTGRIHWHAMWIMSPIFAAVVIWVVMLIIMVSKGGGFE